jgi:Scavenger receptor cysteine-rich domain.
LPKTHPRLKLLSSSEIIQSETMFWGLALIGPVLALAIVPVNSVTQVNVTEINTRVEWTLDDSPYEVENDLLVLDRGELVIAPGVEIQFRAQVGITVRGVLKAEGTEENKIRFIPREPIHPKQTNRTIRLVDGPTVNEGVIQILDQGWWRSVCTNSKNWTAIDMGVACKQLGFQGGEWYHWYPHLNQTRQILFEEPGKEQKAAKSHDS